MLNSGQISKRTPFASDKLNPPGLRGEWDPLQEAPPRSGFLVDVVPKGSVTSSSRPTSGRVERGPGSSSHHLGTQSQASRWKLALLGQPSSTAFFSATLTRPTDEFICSACTVWLFLSQGTSSSISSTVLPSWPNSRVSVLSARPWAWSTASRNYRIQECWSWKRPESSPSPVPISYRWGN